MAMHQQEDGTWVDSPIHGWFGLSRSAYFVMPRLALEAMSLDWQTRFLELMREAEATGLETPDYHVLRCDSDYTTTQPNDSEDSYSWDREFYIQRQDEWANYRHGSVNKLCPSFKAST